ncbi:amidohydrolase [Thermomonas brevis]
MRRIALGLLLSAALPASAFAVGTCPELAVVNARIRTMDPALPQARALAVAGNRIVAVGADADIRALACAGTRIVDAGDKLLLPGFNDAHVHFMSGGEGRSAVDLRDAGSQAEFARRIGAYAKSVPKGTWITLGNWDHERWTPAALPTRQLIDALTPEHPVFVSRLDGHMALANSLALKLAKIDRNTADVAGGEIVRDAAGEPTGVLKDDAMLPVFVAMPGKTLPEAIVIAQAASDYAASVGVTSVQDMNGEAGLPAYQELLRSGWLKTRIYAVTPLPRWAEWRTVGVRAGFGDPMLRVGGLKGFSDGSLGSTTAWFHKPYLDAPDSTGLALEEFRSHDANVSGADAAGLQVMIHAIGDRANDETLKVFERVAQAHGPRDRRFRIEHAQHLDPSLVRRFAGGQVIASMQPFHAIDDGRWAHKRLDDARLRGTYAFRSLLDAGALLAFGTDWEVATLDPMQGIYAAVTRRTLDGKHPDGWYPAEKLTVDEAVRAYTVGSAHAEFEEHRKGMLKPGMLADFVLWSQDIWAVAPERIGETRALLTVVDGRVVYEAQ